MAEVARELTHHDEQSLREALDDIIWFWPEKPPVRQRQKR